MSISTYSYSTQSSITVMDLEDHVPEYEFTTFLWEFLNPLKFLLILLFETSIYPENDLYFFFESIEGFITAEISSWVASAAYELISPRIGTSYSSAGKIVYNYAVMIYFIFSITFYAFFSNLAFKNEGFNITDLAMFTYCLENFLELIGRVERWNEAEFVTMISSLACEVILFGVFSLFDVKCNNNYKCSIYIPTFCASMFLLIEKRYLRISPKLMVPFKWHLLLELSVSVLEFMLFEGIEDIAFVCAIFEEDQDYVVLSISLFYLAMKVGCSFNEEFYFYVIQAQRLFLVTKQGSKKIRDKTILLGIISIIWSVIVYLLWFPIVNLMLGAQLSDIIKLEAKAKLIAYSKNGALRGLVMPLYSYEVAMARAKRNPKMLWLNEGLKAGSMIILIIIMYCCTKNNNICSVFNVETIVILVISLAGLINRNVFSKQADQLNTIKEFQIPEEEVEFDRKLEEEKQNDIANLGSRTDENAINELINNSANTGRSLPEDSNNSASTAKFENVLK